jgi:hypothetical protein
VVAERAVTNITKPMRRNIEVNIMVRRLSADGMEND